MAILAMPTVKGKGGRANRASDAVALSSVTVATEEMGEKKKKKGGRDLLFVDLVLVRGRTPRWGYLLIWGNDAKERGMKREEKGEKKFIPSFRIPADRREKKDGEAKTQRRSRGPFLYWFLLA